jgi:hypothetical protein
MTMPPLACQLTDAVFRARRDGLLAQVRRTVMAAAWQAEGLTLELRSTPDALRDTLDLIAAERQCCPFLRFVLTTGPETSATQLAITGPPGTRGFLKTLGLAEPSGGAGHRAQETQE